MFDFDASKFVLIGIVALIFIPAKDLPAMMRHVGQLVAKMRRMAAEFQGQFMDAMKEADVANIREDLAKLKQSASMNVDFNPVRDVRNSIEQAVSPTPAALPAAAPPMVLPAVEPPAPVLVEAAPEPVAASKKPRARPKYATRHGPTAERAFKPRAKTARLASADEKQA